MTRLENLASAMVLAAVVSAVPLLASQGGQTRTNEQVFALIGCVERVVPPKTATGAPPAAAATPAYKLTDIQPSSSVKQQPKVYDREYLIVGPESIAFSKFQNQWVEVTGTIAPAAAAKTPPPAGTEKPAAAPLGTVTVATIKMVSTECK